MAKFTAAQFIKAIPGTGGVISAIADNVGCDWHTARKYIDEYATIHQAWENERNRITDRAQHNIVGAILEGDLGLSKWWLQVIDPEFMPKQRQEVTGEDGGPLEVKGYVTISPDDWPEPDE